MEPGKIEGSGSETTHLAVFLQLLNDGAGNLQRTLHRQPHSVAKGDQLRVAWEQ